MYLSISKNSLVRLIHLWISINQFWISINELRISKNELRISIIHLRISLNQFMDTLNLAELWISINLKLYKRNREDFQK